MTATHAALRALTVRGSPYDIGAGMGRFGRDIVHAHLIRTTGWTHVTAYRDDQRVRHMRDQVERLFPRQFAELQGMAHGLDVPFADLFAWNCRGDIWAMAPEGCTTVMLPGPPITIAHNEDGDPAFRGHCAWVRVEPADGIAFSSFLYPASLPGHAFALNDAGLVVTVNNIRFRAVATGVPRMVLARAMLDCTGLDQAIDLLRHAERAGGYHLAMAQAGDPRLVSIEFSAHGCSVQPVTAPAVHANHAIHPDDRHIPQIVTDSSASRQSRGDDLVKSGLAARDPLAVLRDRAGPGLPIRRDDPADPDEENTLATVQFMVTEDGVAGQIHDTMSGPARFIFDMPRRA
ncbi:C45 family autoproteolytic acyltransferase/hydolase [Gluconacetobacter tumulisoli]|uniref:Peptidase C45 n=1 Tax=Gluconacetobacter tumulisoli TaxID=1286189 RepID=A0A7W4K609_9PROT|nr:C45 family peptidase [Gluconacetobacter tumulisoli]MBB2201044.1 peptidase C45 [Gluconacetobacter tumulisoli]